MRLPRREFSLLVTRAMDELPPEVQEALENVTVLVQDWPSPEQLESSDPDDPHSLLGLYEGIPQTDRGNYNLVLPDRITLFQRPLEEVCDNRRELRDEVRTTVVHEIAHHFGWSDEELERMGYA